MCRWKNAIVFIIIIIIINNLVILNGYAEYSLNANATSVYGPEFVDPNKMSDEEFYGVWDKETNNWSTTYPGKIDYSYSSTLAQMEAYVKEGDYQSAKEEWLWFMKNINKNNPWATNSDLKAAQLYSENIFPHIVRLSYVGEFTIGNSKQLVEADVSKIVSSAKQYSFQLTARNKNEEAIMLDSRESEQNGGFVPTLVIKVDGKEKEYKAIKDTYIAPNYKSAINFGDEDKLYIKESRLQPEDLNNENGDTEKNMIKMGESWGSATRRTFVQFDLSDLSNNVIIESAKLFLNGQSLGEQSSAIIWSRGDTAWKEKDEDGNSGLNWDNSAVDFFSWQGSEDGIDWKNMPIMGNGYNDVLARLMFITTITGAYATTGNEYYAYHAIRHLMDFITDTGEKIGTFNVLDAGIRSRQMIVSYRSLIKTNVMTSEANSAITKYIWSSTYYLSFDANWRNNHNHGVYELFGMIRMVTNFPMYKQHNEWNDLIVRRLKIIVNNLIQSDGAYKEASTGYASGTLDNFVSIMETADEVGFDLGQEFKDKVRYGMKFIVDALNPDFSDIQYGDTPYELHHKRVDRWAEYYDDDELR